LNIKEKRFWGNHFVAGSLALLIGVSLFATPHYVQKSFNKLHSTENEKDQQEDVAVKSQQKSVHTSKKATVEPSIDLAAQSFIATDPPPDSTQSKDPQSDNPYNDNSGGNFNLKTPKNITKEIVYDPKTNSYTFQNKVGSLNNGPAGTMDLREYMKFDMKKAMKDYWRERAGAPSEEGSSGFLKNIRVPSEVFEHIFGSNKIDIRPSGSLELTIKYIHTNTNNPSLTLDKRKSNDFDFDENIQLNMKAKIGDKIAYDLNYNTLANFDFENKFKLRYEGKEDEIIKVLEFGNVNMPLSSTLIQGSQTLFGGKAQLQFGKLTLTAVVSRQDGDKKTITVAGGSELNKFDFRADDYEEDRHFFIAQYFYDHYNEALATLPLVNSKVNITRIEVWRTNIGSAVTENRNIIALADLGEIEPHNKNIQRSSARIYPDSNANNLLQGINYAQMKNINTAFNYLKSYRGGMISGIDFEKVESARLLSTTEYDFNPKLGFISLHNKLNADQVLAVAFQYTILGDSTVYQVGQFSNEVETPSCLIVKLLKSTSVNPGIPLWKLMMKNVYSLNTYQLSSEDFRLNVIYRGEESGVAMGYFAEVNDQSLKGIPLIRLLGADRLDQQQAAVSDGFFDYIDNAATEGGTIQSSRGRVYFPKVEPFGKDLRAALASDPESADRYAFDSLYSTTKVLAQQFPDKNKFYLEGSFKSSLGSMISLGMGNLAQGSVQVTAGGITLQENVDYTVDYNMGMLRITNEAYMQSGMPLNISVESQTLMGQKKTMFGLNAEYKFSEKFVLGATILNLRERVSEAITKINFGDEPINNTIWGMSLAYQTNSRWLTKALNYLPFYKSTTDSRITLNGEFAHFIPGHSRVLGKGKEAELYIDDFEAAITTYDLKNMSQWELASTPQYQYGNGMFPEAAPGTGLRYGFNRALLSWYNIDNTLQEKRYENYWDGSIDVDARSQMYGRRVQVVEVFPNRPVLVNAAEDPYIHMFDMAYYPAERGPYNYDAIGVAGISAGLNYDGTLKNPASRWGGIMRKLDVTDFENSNIEYIRFWVLDPFLDNTSHKGGKLYINLGDISEDILRDGRKSFEHGLPVDGSDDGVDYTIWGRVPVNQSIVVAFDANAATRKYIDVGFDGLYDSLERVHFQSYLNTVEGILDPQVYEKFYNDPSADNYHYFRGDDYNSAGLGIVERYKYFNNTDGNSPTDDDRPAEAKRDNYPTIATSRPNEEDINNDNTMSEDERYFQYEMDLRPNAMVIGHSYITDIQESEVKMENGAVRKVKWYQFKIPVRKPDKTVGSMSGYNSIRFMRMFLKGFDEPVVLRFAELSLVRGSWRQYSGDLRENGGAPNSNNSETMFTVSTLSLEENAKRSPIPYVMPADVEREETTVSMNVVKQLNEQSLTMKAVNLSDGDARAVYKNTSYDFRRFGTLKLYLHAEKVADEDFLQRGDLEFFIRIGSDFSENYYEYSTPFDLTAWGTKDTALIWPVSNYVTIDLQSLIDTKQERNIANRHGGNFLITEKYSTFDGDKELSVLGNPNMGDVRIIMMGIRNPKKKRLNDNDDMESKSVELWVNELRLGNFEEKSGWAALGSVRFDLADLGDVSASARISTAGFGALEASTYDRQTETMTSIDVAANIQLGKLLPSSWGINLPVHYDFSRNVNTPEYNPLNPDVKLKDDLKTYDTKAERDSIKRQSLDVIQRQNFNIVNARKEKTSGAGSDRASRDPIAKGSIESSKPGGVKETKRSPNSSKNHIWDIENFDFSYIYTEEKAYNIDIEYSNLFTHTGELGYSYSNMPKKIQPFEKAKKMQKIKWLQLIYDFHFYPLPRALSFRTQLYRSYQETKLRNTSSALIIMEPTFAKTYEWSRDYNLAWDLSANIKMDFNAAAKSWIDEPQGRIDTKEKKAQIRKSFSEFGKMNDYSHTFNASWHIPIDKIPIFSFVSANAKYEATYSWIAAARAIDYLGNSIQNTNAKHFDATLNFTTLYNKSKYLRKVNQGTFGSSLKDKPILKKKQQPTISAAELAKLPKQQQDSIRAREKAKQEKQKNIGKEVLDNFLRMLMLVKNASFNYTEGNAIAMTGFMLEPDLLGLNIKQNGSPGFLFVFGDQDEDLRYRASQNGWLSTSDLLNTPYQQRKNTNLAAKITLEPIKDLKIDLTATRTYSYVQQSYYIADSNGIFADYSRQQTGSFSITTFCAGTLFVKDKVVTDASTTDNYKNQNFENFKKYRIEIANRLAQQRASARPGYTPTPDVDGFPDGYGKLDQEVLLYAFWAAYSGTSPDKVNTKTPFFAIPLPNWTISYNGLTRIPGLNKIFQSFVLRHAYTCVYQLGGFTTNLAFNPEEGNYQQIRDALNNFIPYIEVGQVAITEAMNPLIGFDMSLKNSLQFKAEWRRSRSVTLSMANFQVTENSNNEIVIGAGYRIKGLDITFNFAGIKRKTEGELVLRADFSLRDNKTLLRKIEEDINQASAGQRIFQIAVNAEYLFTKNFSIKLFYDHNLTKPALLNQYKTLTINLGLSVKIMLTDL
jgi:hypothetical protein